MGYHAIGIDRSLKQVDEALRRLKIFTDNEVATNRAVDSIEEQFRKNQARTQENPKQQSQPQAAGPKQQSQPPAAGIIPVDLLQKK